MEDGGRKEEEEGQFQNTASGEIICWCKCLTASLPFPALHLS